MHQRQRRAIRYVPLKQRTHRVEGCMKKHKWDEPQDTLVECCCCNGLGVAAICPNCNGVGNIMQFLTLREAQLAHRDLMRKCEVCRGAGQLPITEELFAELGRRAPISFRRRDGQLEIIKSTPPPLK